MTQTPFARPYARAAFERASEGKKLTGWSEQLALLAHVATDGRVVALLADPRVPRARRGGLLTDILSDHLDPEVVNLVRLLADNGRLLLLPAVAEQFERLRAEAEGRVDAWVTSAHELDEKQQKRLTTALKKRLDRDIRLHCSVDEQLIGGVLVRAGDLVIDGSVRGRLQRLAARLTH